MSKRAFLFFLSVLFSCSFAHAMQPPRWVIIPENTRIEFTVMNAGTSVTGEFKDVSGEIHFSPDQLKDSKAHIEVAIASLITSDINARESLKLPEWLDVKTHPIATFDAIVFRKRDAAHYEASGMLKLKGMTKPLDVVFNLVIFNPTLGGTASITGTAVLNRLDFAVGEGEWKSTDTVANQVKLTIHAVATYAPLR